MAQYASPAGIDDATGSPDPKALRDAWHAKVSEFIKSAKGRGETFFYDQYLDSPEIPDSAPSAVPWEAYPKWIKTVFEGFPGPFNQAAADAYAEGTDLVAGLYTKAPGGYEPAEFRARRQDEYCEWAVQRKNGKIVSMQFTAEPPEYWATMYKTNPEWTARRYESVLGVTHIPSEDLAFDQDYWGSDGKGGAEVVAKKGDYNPYNKWNVGEHGLVHLTQSANTLFAEIALAADSSRAWRTKKPSPTEQELICCALYGEASRHSDPLIGWSVHDLVESTGACVALADPIGLYMTPFALLDLKSPTGEAIGDAAFIIPRKSADGNKILRAEVRVPPGATYGLEDCKLGGSNLLYGGQVARRITMALFAVAKKIPGRTREEAGCRGFCCSHPQSSKLLEGVDAQKYATCVAVPASHHRDLPSPPTVAPPGALHEFALATKGVHFKLEPVSASDLSPIPSGRKM